ncbi:putative uncharacterized protein 4 [SARS coronavirus WH20]|uniref:Accessory protein 7a n=1 Tax=SARS coronavirus WH20 TaxID=312027 RepID=Q5DIB9_SARS|nr:putative uncharacterized protein 4 [SARS coronavirus WH20]
MKIILFLTLIVFTSCELYHYQECVRGTTVLLKEPCPSGTYEGNSPFAIPCFNNAYYILVFTRNPGSRRTLYQSLNEHETSHCFDLYFSMQLHMHCSTALCI